jgi:tetratricopeptide (TPR) repeat protein
MQKYYLFFYLFFPVIAFAQSENELQEIDLLIFESKFAQADAKVEMLLNRFFENAGLFYKAALIKQSLNLDKKATVYFRKAVELDSLNINYLNAYANNLAQIGKVKIAISLFEKILQKEPLNFYALDKVSQLYIKQRLYKQANISLEVLNRLYPENPYYLRQMAYCYTKQEDGISALQYYISAYQLDSSDVISIKQLANLYLRAKLYDKAIQFSERGIFVDSTYSDFYRIKAMSHFSKNHNFRALPAFLKTIQYGDSTLEVVKFTGISYFLIKKYKEADLYLKAAFTEDSTDYMVSLYLGRNYFALQNYKDAIKFYEKTYKLLMPDNTILSNFYGDYSQALYENLQYNEALEVIEKRKEIFSYYMSNDLFFVATIYDKMDNKPKAIEAYENFMKSINKFFKNPYEFKNYEYAETRCNRLKELLHME